MTKVTPEISKPRLRFPKAARLVLSSEFLAVRERGTSFHGKLMVLGVLKCDGEGPPRIGIVTSRKVGSAVARSRVRRMIRETVREVRHRMISGFWVVVVARHFASKAPIKAFRAEWKQLCERARLWAPLPPPPSP